jgi:hypothetical protein
VIFAVWVSVAWGSCAAQPPVLALPAQAHPDGPIRAFLHGRWPEDGARQAASLLRVRDPEGELVPVRAEALGARLDLLPARPLPPGRYTLEQHMTYVDGALAPILEPPEGQQLRQAWFAVRELQVGPDAGALGAVPAVDWTRAHVSSSIGPASLIRAQVPPVPGARWLEIEVQGRGVVASFAAQDKGFFVYVSDDVCNAHPVTLPPDEAVTLRAVAVGLDGTRLPGAWTRLEAVGPRHRSKGVPKPQRFAVPLQSEPVIEQADSCGALQRRAQRVVEPELPRLYRFDWAGDGLRRLWAVEGGLWVDGVRVALPGVSGVPANPVMAASGPRTWAAYSPGEGRIVLVALEGGQLLWSRELDGVGTPLSIAAGGEGLEVRWQDLVGRDRRVQHQRFDSEGHALGPPEVDLEGTRADLRGDGLHWLGEIVALPGAGHLQGRVERREGLDYVLYSSYEQGSWLAAIEAGEVLWTRELTASKSHPRSLRFDPQGIVAQWVEDRTDRTAWLSYRGEPVPAFVPAYEPPPPLASVAYAGGEVRLRQSLGSLELSFASPGWEGPPAVIARGGRPEARLRVREGELQVAVTTGAELWLETWACSGQPALGAPRRWDGPVHP